MKTLASTRRRYARFVESQRSPAALPLPSQQIQGQRSPQWGEDGDGESFIFSVYDKHFQEPLTAKVYNGVKLMCFAEIHLHENGIYLGKHLDLWFDLRRPSSKGEAGGRVIPGAKVRVLLEYTAQRSVSGNYMEKKFVNRENVKDIQPSVNMTKKMSNVPTVDEHDKAKFAEASDGFVMQQQKLRDDLFEEFKEMFLHDLTNHTEAEHAYLTQKEKVATGSVCAPCA